MDKQTAKLIARIAENLPDMSENLMQKWIENPAGLQKVLREGLCPASTQPHRSVFKVTVDYRQTLPQMILAGRYDWTNSDVTAKHFPMKGEGEQSLEIALFHFNRSITSEDAIGEMDQAGYRPAKIEELLSLGATQPDLQREFPIIELGSVWVRRHGRRLMAYLDCRGSERELYLPWFGDEWDECCRFAAVRK